MKQFHTKLALQSFLDSQTGTIGFVPTMGALHVGHISLIQQSKKECQVTVASIFVNPTQFNDPSDFEKYPKTLEADLSQLAAAGCDVVYIPSVTDIYPDGMNELPQYALGNLEQILEGKHRPGHFQGVCVVVHRLLDAIKPNCLFMGEKDYQQVAVIRKLIELANLPITLIACPTVREANGLAMSSRNIRLSAIQQVQATHIYKGFKNQLTPEDFTTDLLANGFERVEYISFCDPKTLSLKSNQKPYLILVAACIGGVRLIDNYLIA